MSAGLRPENYLVQPTGHTEENIYFAYGPYTKILKLEGKNPDGCMAQNFMEGDQ